MSISEAEKHRGGSGFLDGQRLGAAQLYQTGPRPEPRHAGRSGRPRAPRPDGLQVSLSVGAEGGWVKGRVNPYETVTFIEVFISHLC